ncbi:MAG: hypothetical protein NTX72_02580 [Candidatus Uhrbacteria bacterium]|nr:hypothetical protein [Candidatus Uhrbacteria bacterium]
MFIHQLTMIVLCLAVMFMAGALCNNVWRSFDEKPSPYEPKRVAYLMRGLTLSLPLYLYGYMFYYAATSSEFFSWSLNMLGRPNIAFYLCSWVCMLLGAFAQRTWPNTFSIFVKTSPISTSEKLQPS